MKKLAFFFTRTIRYLPFAAFLLFEACSNCHSTYTYEPPENTGDGLQTGTLEQVNIDTVLISEAVRKIKCINFNEIHSMLIYKNGKLVLEEYFLGHRYQWNAPDYFGEYIQWNRDMVHPIMSCTKSFTSACIGIAIDKGFINNVNESIAKYLPDHQQYFKDGKENITIEHLLTMTSGLDWDEWGEAHGTSANDVDRLYFECYDDPVKCVLEKELVHPPGENFTYNGGGTVLLGEIVKNASGMDMGEFSKTYLFEPLGIDTVTWYQSKNGVYATDGSMYITPRAMMKFGITYLDNGSWSGEQVISKGWVEKSAEIYGNNVGINIPIEDSGKNGYGYQWWISQLEHRGEKIKMYRANGWGGQTIMVFPTLDMVVVFTSGNYAYKSKLFKLIENYVLPAVG